MTSPKTIRTMCPMNCHPTLCGMLVELDNNTVKSVKGDPDNPDSQGFLCLRGRASQEIIDNPSRLTQPMYRCDRTTDNWQPIGWEQAIALICKKLEEIPPEAFGIWLGHGDAATNYGTRIGGLISRRFANMYGAQWWHPSMICWGLGGFGFGLTGIIEVNTKEDMSAHAELIILWGANLDSQPNTAPHLKIAKKRGARIIGIDIRQTAATAQADDVLIINPGTDGALALAIMHEIITNNWHDKQFIEKHTIGFDKLSVHLHQYTIAWAATQTGLGEDQIRQLAKVYGTTRPAMIVVGGSSMFKGENGWSSARAIACLPGLTGNAAAPGGGLGPRHGAPSHGQGLADLNPECGNRCRAIVPNQMPEITSAIANKSVKALLLSGTNMLCSFADSQQLRTALNQCELIVCCDLFMNDTIRECADIILPATSWLEQLGCKMTHTHVYLMEQALPPAGECHTLTALLRDLATQLSIQDFFPWRDEEKMIDAVLDHPATEHATIAKLRNQNGKQALHISHQGHANKIFSTASGKIEFYSETAAAHSLPALPTYLPPKQCINYPLHFRQGRTLSHFHSFYDHGRALPSLARLETQPQLWISPTDASARDIVAQQPIRIFNQRGDFEAVAHVTDKIPKGTVWMHDGWHGINKLTSGDASLPNTVLNLFPFSVGQAGFDAMVEIVPI